jgi:small subunit ribosomal protein S2
MVAWGVPWSPRCTGLFLDNPGGDATDARSLGVPIPVTRRCRLDNTLVRNLIDAGIHFGHRSSRWNPKMAPYIFGKRRLIHIIDVKETLKGLLYARKFLAQVVSDGKDVLFVGTKRQARKIVEMVAQDTGMHFVNDRWLGGTLTNFRTIRSRLGRMSELEILTEGEKAQQFSKKQLSAYRRELRKIKRNLEGIRNMERLPGAIVLVDQRRELNAVREARKLGIPTVCLLDTDCDPDLVDIAIPGNDDAMRAIELILAELAAAVKEGKAGRVERGEIGAAQQAAKRRSQRPAMGRAETAEPQAEALTEQPAQPPAEPPPAPGEAPQA